MMGESVRYSSNSLAIAVALSALVGSACVEELDPITGITSLRVELVSPTELGDVDNRVADDQRTAVINISALDAMNQADTSLNVTVDIWAHFLGSLTGARVNSDVPLQSVNLVDGVANNVTVELPSTFGPTVIWVEHVDGDDATFATGTTPPIWYRDAFLVDISRPVDESALDAFEVSPLQKKQVNVTGSQYGDLGRMVVTAIYSQGYTIADVECQDAAGTPPCESGDYDSLYIYTHNRPDDEEHRILSRGETVVRLTGGVSEFNGLTELSFPQSFVDDPTINEAWLPTPVVVQAEWLADKIQFERVEAGLIAVEDGVLCPLDEEWEVYNQWKLDIGFGCGQPINVITEGQVPDFDPTDYAGQTIPRVVGTLRPVNIAPFHVWIMYPRDGADLTLPTL